MIPWRSLRSRDGSSGLMRHGAWSRAGWARWAGRSMPWCSPGRARSAARRGQGGAFCPSCRGALLERAAKAAASACPRCALPAGPYADLRRGCGDCRGRSLGFEAAIALGPYEGTLRDLCLRMKHDRDAWLAPWLCDLWVEARGEAVDRLTCRRTPGSCRSRCTGGGTGSAATTRPRPWRAAWPGGSIGRSAGRCGGSWTTEKLAELSATDRAKALRKAFRAGRAARSRAARSSWSTTS